ncbi:MAG: hypothetical protein M3Y56_03465 [Armatimonadota bacterium]|nr:hypothetical protein [Armatimonadota bacterium]
MLKPINVRKTGIALTLFSLGAILFTPPARAAGGWSWKLPPNAVTLDSGKCNPIFYVGEPIAFTLNKPISRFEVRDYWGDVADGGAMPGGAATKLALKNEPPGWYKLYIYGDQDQGEPWGHVVGGTNFVVFRNKPGFPPLPAKDVPGGSYPSEDEPLRGVTGMGPQRLSVQDASKPDEAIAALDIDVALDKKFYLPYDPVRGRALMVAFPNGTKDLAGVRKIVDHFKNDVRYWEPRNEPNGGSSGADFAVKEMKPFYDTVKAVDPNLKVMGPGTVSVGPQLLPWIEDFLKAGGAKYIDVFSFHAYNNVNGDVWLARKALDSLNALLARYGADKLEKWQTEQGFFAAMYGVYAPTHQARWTMVEQMVFEQYGIPKEHNHLWYDKSHGFWDFPTWWENDDGSLNPAAPLMRVWSEELFGTEFVSAYNFGDPGNKLYVGSLFGGPGKRVAAFMSAGSTDGQVNFRVKGGRHLHLVSAFGVERDLPVAAGRATLPVPELPVYVELSPGQSIEVEPTTWGRDLALQPGVIATSSASPEPDPQKAKLNPISKIINGELENWYWAQKPDTAPWNVQNPQFPLTVDIQLPALSTVSHVVVYAAPPWQLQSTLLDYELQVDNGGQWITMDHVQEPTRTIKVYTPATRTTVDTFFSDRWVFVHQFKPVRTQKIRLLIHNATYGGGATKEVSDAGGQAWGSPVVMVREIEVYAK